MSRLKLLQIFPFSLLWQLPLAFCAILFFSAVSFLLVRSEPIEFEVIALGWRHTAWCDNSSQLDGPITEEGLVGETIEKRPVTPEGVQCLDEEAYYVLLKALAPSPEFQARCSTLIPTDRFNEETWRKLKLGDRLWTTGNQSSIDCSRVKIFTLPIAAPSS